VSSARLPYRPSLALRWADDVDEEAGKHARPAPTLAGDPAAPAAAASIALERYQRSEQDRRGSAMASALAHRDRSHAVSHDPSTKQQPALPPLSVPASGYAQPPVPAPASGVPAPFAASAVTVSAANAPSSALGTVLGTTIAAAPVSAAPLPSASPPTSSTGNGAAAPPAAAERPLDPRAAQIMDRIRANQERIRREREAAAFRGLSTAVAARDVRALRLLATPSDLVPASIAEKAQAALATIEQEQSERGAQDRARQESHARAAAEAERRESELRETVQRRIREAEAALGLMDQQRRDASAASAAAAAAAAAAKPNASARASGNGKGRRSTDHRIAGIEAVESDEGEAETEADGEDLWSEVGSFCYDSANEDEDKAEGESDADGNGPTDIEVAAQSSASLRSVGLMNRFGPYYTQDDIIDILISAVIPTTAAMTWSVAHQIQAQTQGTALRSPDATRLAPSSSSPSASPAAAAQPASQAEEGIRSPGVHTDATISSPAPVRTPAFVRTASLTAPITPSLAAAFDRASDAAPAASVLYSPVGLVASEPADAEGPLNTSMSSQATVPLGSAASPAAAGPLLGARAPPSPASQRLVDEALSNPSTALLRTVVPTVDALIRYVLYKYRRYCRKVVARRQRELVEDAAKERTDGVKTEEAASKRPSYSMFEGVPVYQLFPVLEGDYAPIAHDVLFGLDGSGLDAAKNEDPFRAAGRRVRAYLTAVGEELDRFLRRAEEHTLPAPATTTAVSQATVANAGPSCIREALLERLDRLLAPVLPQPFFVYHSLSKEDTSRICVHELTRAAAEETLQRLGLRCSLLLHMTHCAHIAGVRLMLALGMPAVTTLPDGTKLNQRGIVSARVNDGFHGLEQLDVVQVAMHQIGYRGGTQARALQAILRILADAGATVDQKGPVRVRRQVDQLHADASSGTGEGARLAGSRRKR
jgi:hypothetical protein